MPNCKAEVEISGPMKKSLNERNTVLNMVAQNHLLAEEAFAAKQE